MKKQTGFTIVELLIVIVVIAILAAITIVAYNGIQNRANDTAVQSDLRNIAGKIREFQVINDRLPAINAADLDQLGFTATQRAYGAHYTPSGLSDYNLLYCSDGTRFAIVAGSKSGTTFAFRSQGGLVRDAGALVTHTTTCSNQGVSSAGTWGLTNGGWVNWTT
ncbi:type II secretion system protein [Candidatus Saccharibacteria bacterium]|nr:type II secretion system protein [Candidatus Saccharibacteria bacterium]